MCRNDHLNEHGHLHNTRAKYKASLMTHAADKAHAPPDCVHSVTTRFAIPADYPFACASVSIHCTPNDELVCTFAYPVPYPSALEAPFLRL